MRKLTLSAALIAATLSTAAVASAHATAQDASYAQSEYGETTEQMARPAEPRGNVLNWVTVDDYPLRALRQERQGKTIFRVVVTRKGRADNCTILRTSGHRDLDEATCRFIEKRARFTPATNNNGENVEGYWESSITWRTSSMPLQDYQTAELETDRTQKSKAEKTQLLADPDSSTGAETIVPVSEDPISNVVESEPISKQTREHTEQESLPSEPSEPSEPTQVERERQNFDYVFYLVLGILIAIYLRYRWFKSSRRCPNCGVDWALKRTSRFDDPRATFQERRRSGTYSSLVTFETGLRTESFACKECDYQTKRRGSYKKRISTHAG